MDHWLVFSDAGQGLPLVVSQGQVVVSFEALDELIEETETLTAVP